MKYQSYQHEAGLTYHMTQVGNTANTANIGSEIRFLMFNWLTNIGACHQAAFVGATILVHYYVVL